MSVRRLLSAWNADPTVSGNFAAVQAEPPRPGAFRPYPAELHPALAHALEQLGIQQL